MDPAERARRDAAKAQRRMDGVTANPNATPGAGRGSLNSGSPQGMPQGSATPRLDAGVQTPRLDSNPARDGSAVLADRNRTGAFGTGAQNLQQRKDLYARMGQADPMDRNQFKGEAAALGVQPGGWQAALGRLEMKPAAPAAQPAAAPAAPAAQPAPANFGAGIARNNMQTMGIQGAAADYFKRSAANPGLAAPGKRPAPLAQAQTPTPTAQSQMPQERSAPPRQENQNQLAATAPPPPVAATAPLPNQSPAQSNPAANGPNPAYQSTTNPLDWQRTQMPLAQASTPIPTAQYQMPQERSSGVTPWSGAPRQATPPSSAAAAKKQFHTPKLPPPGADPSVAREGLIRFHGYTKEQADAMLAGNGITEDAYKKKQVNRRVQAQQSRTAGENARQKEIQGDRRYRQQKDAAAEKKVPAWLQGTGVGAMLKWHHQNS